MVGVVAFFEQKISVIEPLSVAEQRPRCLAHRRGLSKGKISRVIVLVLFWDISVLLVQTNHFKLFSRVNNNLNLVKFTGLFQVFETGKPSLHFLLSLVLIHSLATPVRVGALARIVVSPLLQIVADHLLLLAHYSMHWFV